MERRKHLFGDWAGRVGGQAVAARAALVGALLLLGAGAAPAAPSESPFAGVPALVEKDLALSRTPGAVVVIGEHGRTVYRAAFGERSLEPRRARMRVRDVFDLASLTKVVATTPAVMQLVQAGRIDLDAPAARYWPAFAQNGKADVTVRELLTHTSGLAPDLSGDWRGTAAALARAAAMRPVRPPGSAFSYSDVNFIVLGEIVRRVSGETLDVYARRHLFRPLSMSRTRFDPPRSWRQWIVPTDRQDGRFRWGEVQDPTAFRMGGVAGHAGVFSNADDLTRFARMLLNGGRLGGARILEPPTVALMTTPVTLPGGARRGLGWDMGSAYSEGMEAAFGPASFGHTGYTGGMIWIDPASRSWLIILTSRLHPNDQGDDKLLREDLGRLVGRAIGRLAAAD